LHYAVRFVFHGTWYVSLVVLWLLEDLTLTGSKLFCVRTTSTLRCVCVCVCVCVCGERR
jgi:hypothetical protein